MLFKCIIGIPARNRVFIPIAHPAPSPLLALPLLGAAGELLLLPLAQLCSLPSLSDFSSPSHRLLSDSLGMVWFSAGWLGGDHRIRRKPLEPNGEPSAQVAAVTSVQQIKVALGF